MTKKQKEQKLQLNYYLYREKLNNELEKMVLLNHLALLKDKRADTEKR